MRRPPAIVSSVALAALVALAACSTGEPAAPDGEPAAHVTPGYPAARLRRLGARELTRSIHDVTGIDVPDKRVSALYVPRKYDNGDPDAWVTPDVFVALESLAWFVADEVVRAKPGRVYAGCGDASACRAQLLGVVLPRVYRRALSIAERDAYGALWDRGVTTSADDAVALVLASALQSPSFLYRAEIGSLTASDGVAELDGDEIATELSYLVTGSTPDDALLEAARDGGLSTREGRLAELDRLLRTPAAAEQARHFLGLYLATEDLRLVRKKKEVYPGFDGAALGVDLSSMLDDVVAHGASTRTLLTLPHELAAPLRAKYGGGPRVEGVLLHPAFLAMHGGFEHSNPVGRGLLVLSSFLCRTPPPPPPGIPRAPRADSQAKTTRGRFQEHSQGSCQACHRAIDGIGFGFEEFDGAGVHRTSENGEPVDASGLLPGDDREEPFRGVLELSARLAVSRDVADCFGKNLVRFALGGGEREGEEELYEALAHGSTVDTSYADRLRAFVQSPAFVERRRP